MLRANNRHGHRISDVVLLAKPRQVRELRCKALGQRFPLVVGHAVAAKGHVQSPRLHHVYFGAERRHNALLDVSDAGWRLPFYHNFVGAVKNVLVLLQKVRHSVGRHAAVVQGASRGVAHRLHQVHQLCAQHLNGKRTKSGPGHQRQAQVFYPNVNAHPRPGQRTLRCGSDTSNACHAGVQGTPQGGVVRLQKRRTYCDELNK